MKKYYFNEIEFGSYEELANKLYDYNLSYNRNGGYDRAIDDDSVEICGKYYDKSTILKMIDPAHYEECLVENAKGVTEEELEEMLKYGESDVDKGNVVRVVEE